MKYIIHVNQHVIKANKRKDAFDPILTCKTYKTNEYAHEVIIMKDGESIGKVVYSQDGLSCGANVWLEFDTNIVDIVTVDKLSAYTVEEKCKIAEANAMYRFKGSKFGEDGCNTSAFQKRFDEEYDKLSGDGELYSRDLSKKWQNHI